MTEVISTIGPFTINMSPMPAPRPRARIVTPGGKKPFVSVYNPPDYMKWKKMVSIKISELGIKREDWNTLNMVFYIPVPASYSMKKKLSISGNLHEQKPDWDNFAKAFMDALQKGPEEKDTFYISPISDDSCLSSGAVRKIWINDPIGKIVFSLAKIKIDPLSIFLS